MGKKFKLLMKKELLMSFFFFLDEIFLKAKLVYKKSTKRTFSNTFNVIFGFHR